MFYRTLNWYRTLGNGWKAIAWVIVAVVAVSSFVLFALPWMLSARLRKQVKRLKTDAALGKARYKISEAMDVITDLEFQRDRFVASEVAKAIQDAKVDVRIGKIDARLEAAQERIKEQSSNEQGDFFNNRYGD